MDASQIVACLVCGLEAPTEGTQTLADAHQVLLERWLPVSRCSHPCGDFGGVPARPSVSRA